jgi:hypothetical protein
MTGMPQGSPENGRNAMLSGSLGEQVLAHAQAGREVVQDFVPLAESLEWMLGQQYLRKRGNKAFLADSSPVPYVVNNGELLLLLTDGMVEAHGPDDNLFGMDRVLDVVRAHQSRTARAIVDTLYGAVRAFCAAQPQLDDMTVIVIKAQPPAGPAAAA